MITSPGSMFLPHWRQNLRFSIHIAGFSALVTALLLSWQPITLEATLGAVTLGGIEFLLVVWQSHTKRSMAFIILLVFLIGQDLIRRRFPPVEMNWASAFQLLFVSMTVLFLLVTTCSGYLLRALERTHADVSASARGPKPGEF